MTLLTFSINSAIFPPKFELENCSAVIRFCIISNGGKVAEIRFRVDGFREEIRSCVISWNRGISNWQ